MSAISSTETNSMDGEMDPLAEEFSRVILMIRYAQTVPLLRVLEKYRKEWSSDSFKEFIYRLLSKLGKTLDLNDQSHGSKQLRKDVSCSDVKKCSDVIVYYIITVIDQFAMDNVEHLWEKIFEHSIAHHIQFYRFLWQKKIIFPTRFLNANQIRNVHPRVNRSRNERIMLLRLGFNFEDLFSKPLSVPDCETLFHELKQKIEPKRILQYLTKPETMSLFLSTFPTYDLNTIDPSINRTILEQIIHMNPFFYQERQTDNVRRYLSSRKNQKLNKTSLPKEVTKIRSRRILDLMKSVILKGGRLSESLHTHMKPMIIAERTPLSITSIGIYALMGLRLDDIDPNISSRKNRDFQFFLAVRNSLPEFTVECQNLLLHRLRVSCSIVHDADFIAEQRKDETIESQRFNDQLFQQSLSLKEWCRLKIKNVCPQRDIPQLGLSQSLIEYCSFDLLSPHYASRCVSTVTQHGGDYWPQPISPANQEVVMNDVNFNDESSSSVRTDDDDDDSEN